MAAVSVIPLTQIPVADDPPQTGVRAATGNSARQWGFVVDLRRCNNFRKCMDACQKEYQLPKDHYWTKTLEVVDKQGNKSYFPRRCMMCENPPCLKVCPTGATFKNENGVVLVNQDRCIGCRMCMVACPYEARYFNFHEPPTSANPFASPTAEFPVPQQKGTVGKCVLCVSNTAKGKLPFCVEACPTLAFYIADLTSDVMTNGTETYQLSKYLYDNDAFRYKEELNTSPRVWYVAGHGQNSEF
jgi:molybdopterin-containing oxidoreductase family iron-sulfur binding subunit